MKNKPDPMELWLRDYPPPHAEQRENEAADTKPEPVRRDTATVLDLHGMTRQDAEKSLRDFIRNGKRKGLRKILVIHGMGLHSAGGAVLPLVVRNELERNPDVLDYGGAEPANGGGGAVWVYLRQRSR